jgi:hypothetical protein
MAHKQVQIYDVPSLMLAAAMASPAHEEQASPDAVTFKSLFSFDGRNAGTGIAGYTARPFNLNRKERV